MAIFIPFKNYDGQTNMSIDETLLSGSIENNMEPVLRIYGWTRPTLTIGRNQSFNGINLEYCKEINIDIVKRPTGGRAVFHHQELTYSFITPVEFLKNGISVLSSYKEISEALIIAFNELGIKLTFPEYKKVSVEAGYCMAVSTGSDLNYLGKKIIGSAQLRQRGYILQHGSILLDIDKNILSNIFFSKVSDDSLTTINEINPELCNVDLIAEALKSGFEKKFTLKFTSKEI